MAVVFMAQQGRLRNRLLYTLFLFFSLCQAPQEEAAPKNSINKEKVSFYTKKGIAYVNGQVFTGTLFVLFPDAKDTSEIQNYLNGKEQGEWLQFYAGQKQKGIRFFKNGKKEGKMSEFWPNGRLKMECYFKNDLYEGPFREWTSGGGMIKEMNYSNGKEQGFQKVWYDNGKIRSNYFISNGRRFGLLGTKNCVNVGKDLVKN